MVMIIDRNEKIRIENFNVQIKNVKSKKGEKYLYDYFR